MGSSSSKREEDKKKKEEKKKVIKNEDNYQKLEDKEKQDNKENNINLINIIHNNKEENENKNKEEESIDNLEELTLDKNGSLVSNNNIVNSPLNKIITIEVANSQKESIKNENILKDIDNNNKYNNTQINIRTEKKEEEPLIIYTEKASQELIINYYDNMLDIIHSFSFRNNFISFVKSLNEIYLYNLNTRKFPETKETNDFFHCFKYASIIIICLIFMTKDIDLFDNTKKKIKENLEQFIYTCLEMTNKDIILSLNILNFINSYTKNKKSLYNCVNQIIRILFKNRESYKNILNCLEQLLSKIDTENIQDIINKINNSILFYYNASTYNNNENENNNNINNNIVIINRRKSILKKSKISLKMEQSFSRVLYKSPSFYKGYNRRKFKTKIKNDDNITKINNIEINEDKNKTINIPYIKEEMSKNKKFCLVLDIDETISHLVKLPFGSYFLIRPGVIELLKELYHYYEIDIFTAALQHYADNILDKLDKKNEYISYRLYRYHCSWEEGKSIKKLELMGRDLTKVVFVDDIERNAKYNMKNLILVSKWSDNIYDEEIINIKNKLKIIAENGKYDNDITIGLINEKLSKIDYDRNNNNG